MIKSVYIFVGLWYRKYEGKERKSGWTVLQTITVKSLEQSGATSALLGTRGVFRRQNWQIVLEATNPQSPDTRMEHRGHRWRR